MDDLDTIRAALSASMSDLARYLFGEPNRRMSNRRELRFGRKGSLAVAIAGSKAGSWCDHEISVGGGPFELIMHVHDCGFRDALDTARDFLSSPRPDAAHEPPAIVLRSTADDDEAARIARAMSYWNRSVDPRGTVVEEYLRSRCIALPDGVAGDVIRFCASPRMMVALMRDIHTDEPCGVHRTFLTPEGAKVEKRMLGRAKGAAIKLSPDEDVTHGLHIGEGIESTLSFMMAGYAPAWALGSAGAVKAFPILSGIEALTIFAENDAASADSADTCGERWIEADREVTLATPQHGDGNDILKEVAA
ncbi:MAG: toprim domain-containing protein [Xanthobacteraceae bacterium]